MPLTNAILQLNQVVPSDHGLLGWSMSPDQVANNLTITSGTIYINKIQWRTTATISNIYGIIPTAGSTLTSGQNLAAVYNSAGTRVALTADQSTAWTTSGLKTMAVTTPVSVPGSPTGFIWVAILSVGTTPPVWGRSNVTPGTTGLNMNLTAATSRFATAGTSQTSLPASITPSSLAQSSTPMFVAVS